MLFMRPFTLLLGSASLLLSTGAMDGQAAASGCSGMSNADAAKMLKVDVGTIRQEATAPETGHTRCVYKSVEKVVGATDALAAELSIDRYHLPSADRAKQQLANLGSPALLVKTADGAGVDDAVVLGEQIGRDVNRQPGFAARHNENIVVVQMSGSFMEERPAGWAYNLQALALADAGAHVTGPLYPDACDVVPRQQLQTLVTLQPATFLPTATGSMGTCQLTATSNGSRAGSVTVTIRRHSDADSIRSARQDGDPGTLAHGTAPGDETIVPGGVRGKATGIHGDTIATIEVTDPDVNAIVSPSYAFRVQRAALQAAGATVQPAPQFGAEPVALAETPATPPTAMASLLQSIGNTHWMFFLPILIPVVLVLGFLRRSMRNRRLLSSGLAGQARITGVSDTGTTVNNQPMVRYDVIITTAGGGEYAASTTKLTSRLVSPASLIGTSQPVRYDANNPQSFVFTNNF